MLPSLLRRRTFCTHWWSGRTGQNRPLCRTVQPALVYVIAEKSHRPVLHRLGNQERTSRGNGWVIHASVFFQTYPSDNYLFYLSERGSSGREGMARGQKDFRKVSKKSGIREALPSHVHLHVHTRTHSRDRLLLLLSCPCSSTPAPWIVYIIDYTNNMESLNRSPLSVICVHISSLTLGLFLT